LTKKHWFVTKLESLLLVTKAPCCCFHFTWLEERRRDSNYVCKKPVGELARALLSFKRHTLYTSNCNSTDYSQFSLVVGLRQMILLPDF